MCAVCAVFAVCVLCVLCVCCDNHENAVLTLVCCGRLGAKMEQKLALIEQQKQEKLMLQRDLEARRQQEMLAEQAREQVRWLLLWWSF